VGFCWFVEGRGVPVAVWGGGVRDPGSLLAELSGKPPPAKGGGRVCQGDNAAKHRRPPAFGILMLIELAAGDIRGGGWGRLEREEAHGEVAEER
jgi:hypothetical protein